ncbi:MAG: HD domain-containing protein [Patulibacter sp.]|nr:HD domain-containing protein [Patulibacter sp.]
MPRTELTHRFDEAFAYASERFAGKVRGNTRVPSIAHAMAVSALALDMGADETEAIAALLHDVVEDGGGHAALDHIRAEWGEQVAALVELSTDEIEPSGRPWREVKEDYLARLPTEPVAALRISLADKADNTRTLLRGLSEEGDALFARHTAGDRDTFLWYYESLVAIFRSRREELGDACASVLTELTRVVDLLRERSG